MWTPVFPQDEGVSVYTHTVPDSALYKLVQASRHAKLISTKGRQTITPPSNLGSTVLGRLERAHL